MKNNKDLIEGLRLKEQALQSTFQWWSDSINKKSIELDKLTNLPYSPEREQKIEKLLNEIDNLQLKGQFEQQEINKFQEMKNKYLFNALVSGAVNMKIW